MRREDLENGELLKSWMEIARSIARRMGLCPTAGEDACQGVLTKLLGRRDLLERVEARAYVERAIRHRLIDLVRSPAHVSSVGEVGGDVEERGVSSDRRLVQTELRAGVDRALQHLRGRRKWIMRIWVEQFLATGGAPDYRALAAEHGLSESAAASLISRGLCQLRDGCLREGIGPSG